MKTQPKRKHFVTIFRKTVRFLIASPVIVLVIVAAFAIPLAAFEAHVVNVTATIEPPPICDALSKGYWANHEGCSQGGGTSDWESEINDLSANNFSGVFAGTTGAEICQALWIPNCPSGGTLAARLCRAKAQTLADELNIVSDRLQLNALIALADDGDPAFDNLGLSSISTVEEALIVVEAVIADSGSTSSELRDAAHVAQRIYAFYEDENPNAPMCIFDPDDIPEKPSSDCIKTDIWAFSSPLAEGTILEGDEDGHVDVFGDACNKFGEFPNASDVNGGGGGGQSSTVSAEEGDGTEIIEISTSTVTETEGATTTASSTINSTSTTEIILIDDTSPDGAASSTSAEIIEPVAETEENPMENDSEGPEDVFPPEPEPEEEAPPEVPDPPA